jgi:hypothetical protein
MVRAVKAYRAVPLSAIVMWHRHTRFEMLFAQRLTHSFRYLCRAIVRGASRDVEAMMREALKAAFSTYFFAGERRWLGGSQFDVAPCVPRVRGCLDLAAAAPVGH